MVWVFEYPNALRGPCSWGDKAGVPTANGPPVLLPSADSPTERDHIVSSGCSNYKYKYKYIFVCVCACCVYVCPVCTNILCNQLY